MDKVKGLAKGGWHPPGDPKISRATWKSDLKGMATNRNKDPYEEQRNHQSAPLTTLKDPDSFGPPPKRYGVSTPTSPAGSASSAGGFGSAVNAPIRRQTQEQQVVEEQAPRQPPGPYRVDTTGINTATLPKPPVRRADSSSGGPPVPPPRTVTSPPLPSRQSQPPPPAPRAQHAPAQRAPLPSLPPRMNEYPDESTPPPPPTYQQATEQPAAHMQPAASSPATINGVSVGNLARAGVNVPGFGIGGSSSSNNPPHSPSIQGHPSQLSELQQRFSRLGAGGGPGGQASPPPTSSSAATGAAQKKPAPPPPPKKAALGASQPPVVERGSMAPPPPLPLSSKPRPS